jgi:hypothetical protein
MPTPTLDDVIRELARRGEISDISLSMNASGTKWRASFVPCSRFGRSVAEDEDPVKALTLALGVKLAKRREPSAAVIEQATVDLAPDLAAG